MKKGFLLLLFFAAVSHHLHAQEYDSVPPYQKDSTIPAFSILQTDSTWFNKEALPENKPVVIIYFSPDCGHCQLTAHEFDAAMKKMKNIFFVWVSYRPVPEIKTFDDDYHLSSFKNVRIGRDLKYFVPSFFRVKFTPFMAVYNKEGKLLQTYEQGTEPATIIQLLNGEKE